MITYLSSKGTDKIAQMCRLAWAFLILYVTNTKISLVVPNVETNCIKNFEAEEKGGFIKAYKKRPYLHTALNEYDLEAY